MCVIHNYSQRTSSRINKFIYHTLHLLTTRLINKTLYIQCTYSVTLIHCWRNFEENICKFVLWTSYLLINCSFMGSNICDKQRVLMHGHQGWNVRHGLCHIYMIYVYIWVVYSFCLFCCLFIIVTTQFVALYKPCKPKPKPSAYDPPDSHPLAEIQIPILRPEPKQRICHQHANTDHFGK